MSIDLGSVADKPCFLLEEGYGVKRSFLGGSVVKNLLANAGDMGSILESGRSSGKEMATHSSILAWEIP